MANSVTLNVILSNYMVDLAYAVDCIQNPAYGGSKDSYFQLVRDLDETNNNLPDQTRLVLDMVDGDGTFKSRNLVLGMTEVWGKDDQVKEFFNLNSIWYCKKVAGENNDKNTIGLVDEMNNLWVNNPYGGNPFDKQLVGSGDEQTFNEWLGTLNCIIENRFYKNVLRDDGAKGQPNKFGDTISNCRYLLCASNGFFGLQEHWMDDETSGEMVFQGFMLHDIGSFLPILGKDLYYRFCSFHVIGDSDETTLFLAVQEKDNSKYHYLYLNESSIDETYGFTEIDSVVVD